MSCDMPPRHKNHPAPPPPRISGEDIINPITVIKAILKVIFRKKEYRRFGE